MGASASAGPSHVVVPHQHGPYAVGVDIDIDARHGGRDRAGRHDPRPRASCTTPPDVTPRDLVALVFDAIEHLRMRDRPVRTSVRHRGQRPGHRRSSRPGVSGGTQPGLGGRPSRFDAGGGAHPTTSRWSSATTPTWRPWPSTSGATPVTATTSCTSSAGSGSARASSPTASPSVAATATQARSDTTSSTPPDPSATAASADASRPISARRRCSSSSKAPPAPIPTWTPCSPRRAMAGHERCTSSKRPPSRWAGHRRSAQHAQPRTRSGRWASLRRSRPGSRRGRSRRREVRLRAVTSRRRSRPSGPGRRLGPPRLRRGRLRGAAGRAALTPDRRHSGERRPDLGPHGPGGVPKTWNSLRSVKLHPLGPPPAPQVVSKSGTWLLWIVNRR